MSILNNSLLLGADAAAGGYQISRSVRFNSSDSAYLSRTPASSSNRKTWTWAGWVKKTKPSGGGNHSVFGISTGASTYAVLRFGNGGSEVLGFDGDLGAFDVRTIAIFRDPSAWYHIVLSVDTTQATAANRVQLYVNGTNQATTGTQPSQNSNLLINTADRHDIGNMGSTYNAYYFDGYLADIHFIDGQALDPSSFGEFDTNNVWQPKAFSGTYGTNGFHLPFSDNSTAAALGTDTSSNGNTWTVNNISVTAGAGNDSLVDSPTSYGTDTGVGGEVRGNYATLNPLEGNQTLANGNLDFTNVNAQSYRPATIALTTGKWYCEFTASSAQLVPGLVLAGALGQFPPGATATSWGWYGGAGLYNNSSFFLTAFFTAGDLIQLAFDADSGKLWFGKNGTWLSSGNPATGTNQAATPGVGTWLFAAGGSSAGSGTLNANFGQRPFAYTAPSGFKALCTTNLPEPTIADGSTAMDVKLYTGNGSTQTISGLNFSPDLIWIKNRNSTYHHALYDTIRGSTKMLSSSETAAEITYSSVTSQSAGFDLSGAESRVNENALTYVAWTWDAGSSTVTNTQGSITSQVRANASAGFSVAKFTCGSGVTGGATIGHGLNAAPSFYIFKATNTSGAWVAIHSQNYNNFLYLSSTLQSRSISANGGGTPANPTSTVLSVYDLGVVLANNTFICYAFAPVVGYSSFGSYTGNGSTDGPFVFCNFRPAFVLIKNATTADTSWVIYDNRRNGFNETEQVLNPNLSGAEATYSTTGVDFLSNGFKSRGASSWHGNNGATVIYAAFAEHPFATSRAR